MLGRRERPPAAATTLIGVAIDYTTSLAGVAPDDLEGFFEGWPSPPSTAEHLEILHGSDHVVLARAEGGAVVGFVTAISDGHLSAFIPLLEVLPRHRGQGVGSELVRRLLGDLDHLYAIDVVCDAELRPFYERFGMVPLQAMALRRR
jgi:ribosomal protein S18 acetylase RimI-like enzyme